MSAQTSRFFINSINEKLLSCKKRKFTLKSFLTRKLYNIDEIYGLFSDDYTFQFVRESSIPFETWEEVKDKSPFTYYELVHKRQFQLFNMENGSYVTEPYIDDIPWHSGDSVDLNGHIALPIRARTLIPKDFIRHNRIDEADLERFSNFVTRIMATDPTLLESYFPKAVEPQKTF